MIKSVLTLIRLVSPKKMGADAIRAELWGYLLKLRSDQNPKIIVH